MDLQAVVTLVRCLALAAAVGVAHARPQLATPALPTGGGAEDLSALTLDELIRRLPPAGEEMSRDRVNGGLTKDLVSAEMGGRLDAGVILTDQQWREALILAGVIRFHARWPKDEDYRISLTVPRWLRVAQIRLSPQVQGMTSTSVGELSVPISGTYAMIDARDARQGRKLGKVPPGTSKIIFDVEVERGRSDPFGIEERGPPPGVLWKGTVTVPVELVETFDQIADAVTNEEMERAVRDAVGAGLREWGDEPRPIPFLVIDPDCAQFPILETTGLDLRVEVLRDGAVLSESWLVATDADSLGLLGSISKGRHRFYGSTNLKLDGDTSGADRWVLRLTGQSDHIRGLWEARQRWSGVIEIPWTEAVKHEAERVGPAGRGPEMSTPYWK